MRSCFLSSCIEFYSAVAEKELKMSLPISGKGGQLGFHVSLAEQYERSFKRWKVMFKKRQNKLTPILSYSKV